MKRQSLAALALLLALCVGLFWRVFLRPGEVVASPVSDVVGQFGYWERFLHDALRETGTMAGSYLGL